MKLACVQANVAFGEPELNAAAVVRNLETLAALGTDFVVFPECFLTGYCVDSAETARAIALPREHEALKAIREACDRLEASCVVGFAEASDESLHNAAAFFEPGVEPRYYRKTHLPELGLDKHVAPGRELDVFETRFGKIGILICFDQRVPEAARVLALKGAELIVLPTNWPEGAESSADVFSVTRAAENRVYYAACNRVGREHGFRFIGRSKIVHPSGRILAVAGESEETIVAEIELADARNKRAVVRPGEYEWTVFESRRPELYGVLVEPQKPQGS